jgi:hypothetical protein
MPLPYVRSLLFLAALERRPLADHELSAISRLPYWLRWERC